MEPSNPTANATALISPALNVWRALEARGTDPEPIFRRAGIDPALLIVPGKRLPVRATQRLMRMVDQVVNDPPFGIDVAKQMHGTAMHAVGYAWLSSATLAEGLRRLTRYFRVLSEIWSLQLEETSSGTRASYAFTAALPEPPLWLLDWLPAGLVRLSRLTYGESFAPLEAALVRQPPDDPRPFKDWFRCPIVWGAARTSVLFRREDLTLALPTANPDVALANERVALEYLERLDRADVTAQVRRRILEQLPSGPPTQTEIARRLALSPRTLHRRLADTGTSFADLLDEMRRELAAGYLQRTEHSVAEVAYLLGFAEVSSFNRAFRRWTGKRPTEFRGTTAALS
ncbi:MAG TPA: AraC family transcriptional regulator [Burkholderiales bacterium]|nr:AraC family transcriptional regulator [Burkholderiales bacterium]